ncbi:hypothetical protein BCA33_01910 [Marinobacter sp. AC-23]|nr:hypothetical protein BCA33_01910 [Marinobacter sp. AC-23]
MVAISITTKKPIATALVQMVRFTPEIDERAEHAHRNTETGVLSACTLFLMRTRNLARQVAFKIPFVFFLE